MIRPRPVLPSVLATVLAFALFWVNGQATVHAAYHAFEEHAHDFCHETGVHLHSGDEAPCWLDLDAVATPALQPERPSLSFLHRAVYPVRQHLPRYAAPHSQYHWTAAPLRGPPACAKA
jgi:hypothetical protein